MNRLTNALVFVVACATAIGSACATPLLEAGGNSAGNWYIVPYNDGPGNPYGGVGGAPPNEGPANGVGSVHGSGFGGIPITGGAAPDPEDPPNRDDVYDSDLGGLDWSSVSGGQVRSLRFDFFADANADGDWDGSVDAPAQVSLYFIGEPHGGQSARWSYVLPTPNAPWTYYQINLYETDWFDVSGNGFGETEFKSDIQDFVSRVGVSIAYNNSFGGQHYGIGRFTLDNEYYVIPEPQTYASLAAALLSVGVAFRRRLHALVPTGHKTAAA